MLPQIKPQKGKAFDKLPLKTIKEFDDTTYLLSTKYDGNMIFIVKVGGRVHFYTSDWKPFYIGYIASYVLAMVTVDFVAMGEFMYGCEGKLGDRVHSAKLTTYRTNYSKLLGNDLGDEMSSNIKIFDFLEFGDNCLLTSVMYIDRLVNAKMHLDGVVPSNMSVIETFLVSGRQARDITKALVKDGWEGTMLVEPDSHYHVGKRVNHSIKLKPRKTADLLCIGIEPGDGKYTGLIGSLLLKDSEGRVVSVGSGLSDDDRAKDKTFYIGKTIEIEYEQILDTYIQPTLPKGFDRGHKEID